MAPDHSTAEPPAPDAAAPRVFLHYTRAELDRAYDQRVWAPSAAETIRRYGATSARVHADFPPWAWRYGDAEAEVMDVFRPLGGETGRPVLVFLHGGAWRSLSRADAAAAAPTFLRRGALYVAPGFPVIPQVRLPGMVDSLRRAMLHLWRTAAELGGDPGRIVLVGHSSGAHLAATLLTTDWAALGGPAAMFRGGLCLSGSYDLQPAMLSARGDYLGLDAAEVEALSPARHLDRLRCPVSVAWCTAESPEFIRQGQALSAGLHQRGRLRQEVVVADTDHFAIQERLADQDTEVARAALDLLGV